MTDFKIHYDDRTYTMFLESSQVNADTVEVKIIMYKTVYAIFKDKTSNTWNNHISKFEIAKGLLTCIGSKLDEYLNV